MSDAPSGGRERLIVMPPEAARELAACTAIDRLGVSLRALKMAMAAAVDAPGTLGLPDETGKLGEAGELRARWAATHLLLRGVTDAVERDGDAVINAVKAMLALE